MSLRPKKVRIDVLLVERRIAPDLERSRSMIMSGKVLVDDVPVDKAGQTVPLTANVRIKGGSNPFVSRGGLKLAKALAFFECDVEGKICLDVGASTGGFTDCLLQNGAKRVYAVDVGYGQMAASLVNDDRVRIFDKINMRYADASLLPSLADFVVVDVSFISLVMIFPSIDKMIQPNAEIISLVKPQFEVEKFWMGALKQAAVDGDIDSGSLMAGQAVGLADEIKSVKEVINELIIDGEKELENISKRLMFDV